MPVNGTRRVAYRDDAEEPGFTQVKVLPSRPSAAAVESPRSATRPHPVVSGVRERIARQHSLAYRVSFPLWPGRNYYLALFIGREQRGRARLAEEGQTSVGARSVLFGTVAAFVALMTVLGTACFGYLVKSALG
jgi:hypothetical protein